MSGLISLVLEARSYFLGRAQLHRMKKRIGFLGINRQIERLAFAIVPADGAPMLAPAIAELDVFLLQKSRIGEHRQAQIDSGWCGVNRPLETVVHQRRKVPAVIDMGVRQDHSIDTGYGEREITVPFVGVSAPSLE